MIPLPLALSLLAAATASTPTPVAPATATERPRLVVVVVVDQMRADYIDRYGGRWTGGLRRLLHQGAVFRQAAYPYLSTLTCVGHATISTGTLPRTHGVPQNAWWDAASGASLGCTQDPSQPLVGLGGTPPAGGQSPFALKVPTFSDELRAQATVTPKVAVFSSKPYPAIMLAGHRGDAVAWYAGSSWATSTAYAATPSPALLEIARAASPEAALDLTWDRQGPASAYAFDDDAPGEQPPAGWTRTFPHVLRGAPGGADAAYFRRWLASPFADESLAALARAAVEKLKMGQGPGTDYLAVSFSSLDYVGHAFGPRSHEVQDLLLRLDATLGRLLADLDRLVGPDHYVVAWSADHGVAPIPEQMTALGVEAGRLDTGQVKQRIDQALTPLLGPGPAVAWAPYSEVYFLPGVMDKLRLNPQALKAAMEAAASVPGVARVFVGDDLGRAVPDNDPAARAAALGYVPGRSGDLVLVPKVHWIPVGAGTTHGSPYLYDARVPLVLMGPGIKAGDYLGAATPADIAPTLAYLTGITLPQTEGRVLREALEPRPLPAKKAPGR